MILSHRITNITNTPFDNPHVKRFIKDEIRALNEAHGSERVIRLCDPFAREGFVGKMPNCISNDLNPEFPTDHNLEFKDFAKLMHVKKKKFDLVVFDPPYSLRMLNTHYLILKRSRGGVRCNNDHSTYRNISHCSIISTPQEVVTEALRYFLVMDSLYKPQSNHAQMRI
jgi:16S rRNA G966 N2-methylase RsmD